MRAGYLEMASADPAALAVVVDGGRSPEEVAVELGPGRGGGAARELAYGRLLHARDGARPPAFAACRTRSAAATSSRCWRHPPDGARPRRSR